MLVLVAFILINISSVNSLQIVVNTWPFTNATDAAWTELTTGKRTAVDAVVTGCGECETQQCDGTVGYGGDPDENGETTLDAMIMDGRTMDVGAVGCLRRIKSAIAVARAVMDHTDHTLLAGELATQFAVEMGFKEEDLSTNRSIELWKQWKNNNCQPNHRMNVSPDPSHTCGPYTPNTSNLVDEHNKQRLPPTDHRPQVVGKRNFKRRSEQISFKDYKDHDTIGMVAIDSSGNIASGTSTNGLNHKVPGLHAEVGGFSCYGVELLRWQQTPLEWKDHSGRWVGIPVSSAIHEQTVSMRVGDSPVMGAGSYAKNGVGAAAATGDGDVMMRFLPSFQAVSLMELLQLDPTTAARKSIEPMIKYFPNFHGAVLVVHHSGTYGAACYGIDKFPFSVRDSTSTNTTVKYVTCMK